MALYRVSVVGTGYVGLCTAVGFASKGYEVITSTNNPEKARLINTGTPPFFEPGLEEMLKKAVSEGYLKCVVGRKEAILNTEITFIAVATPSQPDGSISLQHIQSSAREIGEALNKKNTYHLVVVKSTVVPGTTENIVKPILEKLSNKRCGTDFGLCMNPEFLRQGSAVHDSLHPDRIIIGEHDKVSGDTLQNLYQEFYSEELPPVIRTNIPTAELIKYANNAFLATKVSLINQIANICEKLPGTDVNVVAKAIGLDRRIAPLFLNAGLGYGGSCLPKDLKALISFSKDLGYDPALLNAVELVNNSQPHRAVELAKKALGDLEGKRIAILGLAFKPNTDDIRESVSIKIINKLLEDRASVIAYDPAATTNTRKILGDRIKYASCAIECINGADCCIVVTEWDEFKQLKPHDFINHMKKPLVIDGRRIFDSEEYGRKLEFTAIGLGR